MSKEAMKLALEALDGLEALLLSMGLTHLIVYGDAEKAITSLSQALSNEALDRMAENARELGLDYGVEQDLRVFARVDAMRAKGLLKLTATLEQPAQPQQEPVAWMYDWICEGKRIEGWIAHKESEIPMLLASNIRPLYTSPPTLSLAQRQSHSDVKPLTDEEIESLWDHGMYVHCSGITALRAITRAIEAKLKEKNT